MTALFLKIVNTGISAGWVVLAVLAVRLVLRKAPKWTHVLLWGIVALRLIFPFSLESALSLIPSAQTLPDQLLAGPSFQIHTGVPPVDQRVNEYLGDRYFEGVSVPTGSGRDTMTLFCSTLDCGNTAFAGIYGGQLSAVMAEAFGSCTGGGECLPEQEDRGSLCLWIPETRNLSSVGNGQ